MIITSPDTETKVYLPGKLREVQVGVFGKDDGVPLVNVGVRTANWEADTLGGYLAKGDFYSAAAMVPWAEKAEGLLFDKMDDPFAAALGAYLLLRLRTFDLMHSRARNLANFFSSLPDGSVIWAWQQIFQKGEEQEIREYLFRAASSNSLPVFTEGIKLLMMDCVCSGQKEWKCSETE